MKKIYNKQILVSRSSSPPIYISFFEVIKSTTNTCELRELKKRIVEQSYDEQEVVPIKNEYSSKPFRRKVLETGCVKIDNGQFAWPWDGNSQWQSILIFMP